MSDKQSYLPIKDAIVSVSIKGKKTTLPAYQKEGIIFIIHKDTPAKLYSSGDTGIPNCGWIGVTGCKTARGKFGVLTLAE